METKDKNRSQNQETKFVKEVEEDTKQFVFQKNKKTISGAFIIVALLIILVVGVIISGIAF
jgi:maltodextrin utilization protein YvdJ